MADYKTPGVYIQEQDSFGSSMVLHETAIPSFIGFTQIATQPNGDKLNKIKGSEIVYEPVMIRSILEYELAFGKGDDTGNIIIQQAEGSSKFTAKNIKNDEAYSPGLMHPSILNFFSNGGGICYIISIGDYDSFNNTVNAINITEEIESIKEAIKQAETTTLIVPTDLIRFGALNYYTWGTQLINFASDEKRYFTIMDVVQSDSSDSVLNEQDILEYRNYVKPDSPSYAGAYYPYLKSLTPYAYKNDLSNVYYNGNKLDKEVVGEQTYEGVKTFLKINYINMPPSPYMAGIYSGVDSEEGVWVAPANTSPIGIVGPVVVISDNQQNNMNQDPVSGISVNAIRSFTGRGTLVWGARTNDGNSNDWKYISIRRLAISIETDINSTLQAYVFKPNVHNTWVEIKTMIESYLLGLYGQGALVGSTPQEGYAVRIGLGETMTESDVMNGDMILSVLFAPIHPAEFIILKFIQKIGQ